MGCWMLPDVLSKLIHLVREHEMDYVLDTMSSVPIVIFQVMALNWNYYYCMDCTWAVVASVRRWIALVQADRSHCGQSWLPNTSMSMAWTLTLESAPGLVRDGTSDHRNSVLAIGRPRCRRYGCLRCRSMCQRQSSLDYQNIGADAAEAAMIVLNKCLIIVDET